MIPKTIGLYTKIKKFKNFGVYQFKKPSNGCVKWDINNNVLGFFLWEKMTYSMLPLTY